MAYVTKARKYGEMSIKRSLKTSWWLFTANNDSPKSVAFTRFALVATPIFLGLGVALSFAVALHPAVGLFMGLTTAYLAATSMVKQSRAATARVETYLKDDDQDIIGPTDYIKMYERPNSTGHTLAYYQSWGEWMSLGHIPLDTFIDAILEVDPLAGLFSEEALLESVQYQYAQSYFSKSLNREALRIVHKSDEGAFPITRMIAPTDLELDIKPQI